jgi:hypothetical protein
MTSRYVHFSARDLEDAVLELYGLKTTTKDTGIAKLFDCPRCGNKNPAGKVRCACCGIVLNKETCSKTGRCKSTTNRRELYKTEC